MLVVLLLLHNCVSTANLAKNRFVYQSQRILANFMQTLSLGRRRCMCDISAMYLWYMRDDCAAYCYMPKIKIIQHLGHIWNYKERHCNATATIA